MTFTIFERPAAQPFENVFSPWTTTGVLRQLTDSLQNESLEGYIVRVSHDQMERQLFLKKELFVGIRRKWAPGLKTIFVKRVESGSGNHQDQFIGSGSIERFVDLNDLTDSEKQKCIENNWYGKIVFSLLVRLLPPVPAGGAGPSQASEADSKKKEIPERLLLQTGMYMKNSEIEGIERQAKIRITL